MSSNKSRGPGSNLHVVVVRTSGVSLITLHYAVVTPLRKTASYEQRNKTNLGNQNFRRRIIT